MLEPTDDTPFDSNTPLIIDVHPLTSEMYRISLIEKPSRHFVSMLVTKQTRFSEQNYPQNHIT